MRTPGFVAIAGFPLLMVACGSSTPSAPTIVPGPFPAIVTVTSLAPTLGSTAGATEVRIVGGGMGATVTFGGAPAQGRFDSRSPNGLMVVYTPAHAAGTVDVVVSGVNGQSLTLKEAYTYASPQTFDFNGHWSGFGYNGQDTPIVFTIQNDMLLSAKCLSVTEDPDGIVTFSPPRPVINGEFSYAADGVVFSGRIVSPTSATGVIRLGPCASDAWYAAKQ